MKQSSIHAAKATCFILIALFFLCCAFDVHAICFLPVLGAFMLAVIESDNYEKALKTERWQANDLYERAE